MGNLLQLDETKFQERFDREPIEVHHRLHDHPLFTFEAIAELADALPRDLTGRLGGSLPVAWGEADDIPRGGEERPGDVVRAIEENASRLMLWEIEQKPEYRALTNGCLDELQACVANQSGPLRRRMVRMFVSSPGSVTPAHYDVEQNLILQIRGKKALTVGRFASPTEEQRALERWWDGGCNQNIDTLPPELVTFNLEPGTGAYLPYLAPHWTVNGDEPSVTLSMFFRTRASERYELAQAFNSRCRRLSHSLRPPGLSPRIDGGKAAVVRTYALAQRLRGQNGKS
jgi:Cupin superfamily protein